LGQADLSDKTRSGRPVTASDQLHQDHVEELILGNCRIKQKEIAIALGISKERVGHIIGLLFIVSERFVPDGYARPYTNAAKRDAIQCCRIHHIAQIWLQVNCTCSQN